MSIVTLFSVAWIEARDVVVSESVGMVDHETRGDNSVGTEHLQSL